MPRILVIDDELEVRVVLEKILQSAGHEAVLAANGVEGLRQYRQSAADLVITDLFMPELDGLESIMAFRREFPEAKLIAISGNIAADAMLSVARRLGALMVLEKPFTPEQLLAAIEKVLAR